VPLGQEGLHLLRHWRHLWHLVGPVLGWQVDGLGKACNAVGDAIKITKKYTEASACPASASTVVMSLAAVVVALATMF
jgi:hypothetical protein